jgi:hypothetical protein
MPNSESAAPQHVERHQVRRARNAHAEVRGLDATRVHESRWPDAVRETIPFADVSLLVPDCRQKIPVDRCFRTFAA